MKRLLFGLVVIAAAVVYALYRMGDDPRKTNSAEAPPPVTPAETNAETPAPKERFGGRRKTRTSLKEHRWLSELERSLQREDMRNALYFGAQVAEDMTAILKDKTLTANLIALIREYGAASSDPNRRDAVLRLLIPLRHPEATAIIETEYYKSVSEKEQLMLLDAMARPWHKPQQAGEWAVDKALHGTTKEHRDMAFESIRGQSKDFELMFSTARQVLDETTRADQRVEMAREMTNAASNTGEESHLVLLRLMREADLGVAGAIIGNVQSWGDERAIDVVQDLASRYPQHTNAAEEIARNIRLRLKHERGESIMPEDERPAPLVDPKEKAEAEDG